jgi:hypothetical protein
MQSAYPIDPALTAIAIAYANPGYIADQVAPRIPVNKQEFTFMKYDIDQNFNIPDTRVGRKSKPNEVELTGAEVTDSTEDHGLDGGVPNADIANADARYDPLGNEVAYLNELIALAREKRVSNVVHNAASYPVGLKETLSGTGQFTHASSDPIGKVSGALDIPIVRPNQMVFSQYGWTKFRALPAIVEAVLGTGASKGLVSREAVAALFEVQEVVVGTARANAARRGQAPVLTRLWGKHLALLHKAPVPQAKGALQFMGTFEWGSRIASQWEDKNMGMRGGIAVRTGESLKERVIADQAGYFFEDAFA